MLFLHPDQQALVDRQFAAEARIRGGAGTGKTVVALHRAAELGRRYDHDKILFTTFSKSLTDHLGRLFQDLPDAPPNVEFLNIDRIAAKLAPATPEVCPAATLLVEAQTSGKLPPFQRVRQDEQSCGSRFSVSALIAR